jgi:hypothetical protein
MFLDELADRHRAAAGDLLDHVVRPGHEAVVVVERDRRDVLCKERDVLAGDLPDPLLPLNLLVPNLFPEGLADDLGDLRRRQLKSRKSPTKISAPRDSSWRDRSSWL